MKHCLYLIIFGLLTYAFGYGVYWLLNIVWALGRMS
jgi:hypothetical protein